MFIEHGRVRQGVRIRITMNKRKAIERDEMERTIKEKCSNERRKKKRKNNHIFSFIFSRQNSTISRRGDSIVLNFMTL